MHTLAEKFWKLTKAMLGVGAIAIIQWVASTSDSGEPILTRPLAVSGAGAIDCYTPIRGIHGL